MPYKNQKAYHKSGSLRFQVILEPDEAKLFLEDCKLEERDMSKMGRLIIKRYYRGRGQLKAAGFVGPTRDHLLSKGHDQAASALVMPPDSRRHAAA